MEELLLKYPFRCVLSFKPLIDFWNQTVGFANGGQADEIRHRLAQAPELQEPIEDFSVLEPHRDLIRNLMSVVFPEAFWETHASAAIVPFSLQPVLVSPPFERLLLNGDCTYRGRPHLDGEAYAKARLMRAYFLILRELYGIHEGLDFPLIRIVPDPETGLERHFKLKPNFRFVEVRSVGAPEQLTDDQRATILEHLGEPEIIRKILPPENFELRGFTVLDAIDVTESELLSTLERDLVDRDSIVSQTGFLRLQERLRTLFHSSSLVAGVAAIQDERVLLLSTGREITHNCIFGDSRHVPKSYFEGSVFHRAVENDSIMVVRDLMEEPCPAQEEEGLIRDGQRAVLVAPLKFQGEIIGTFNLTSPIPGEFGPTAVMLAEQIVPVFSMALKRALDELNSAVQRVIKEKCTAVHPSVEWRFQQVVYDHLETLHRGEASELEAIVFRDVFPLYAASDIRGSSDERNRAIQADLSEHLRLAVEVVESAGEARSLPILQELAHRINGELRRIEQGVGSGDDLSVIRFLRGELEPVFPIVRKFDGRVESAIRAYEQALEPTMGTVYRKRKAFEASVSRFNERLSSYLEREEAEAQAAFPHYFDKHQTDGLDYVIYLGASMVEDGDFDQLYVRNMRLWQLMVACGIAWHTEQLKSVLDVPLDVTHLVLVHNTPLSIRFRFDEKRFDVDGAYDVAHEIVRSRIDKAMVRGGKERLTQPEKIAIVYSRPEEAREMLRHIDFLRMEGYLRGDVESLDLEDLQGVQGLKALRVAVNLESTSLAQLAQRLDSPAPH